MLNRIKHTALVLFATVLLIGFSTEAMAFVLQKRANQYEYWDSADMPVSYWINTSGMPAGAEDAIIAAFDTWQNVASANISFTYEGTTSLATVADDGENVVFWVTSSAQWTHGSRAAYTTVHVDGLTGQITGVDM